MIDAGDLSSFHQYWWTASALPGAGRAGAGLWRISRGQEDPGASIDLPPLEPGDKVVATDPGGDGRARCAAWSMKPAIPSGLELPL